MKTKFYILIVLTIFIIKGLSKDIGKGSGSFIENYEDLIRLPDDCRN